MPDITEGCSEDQVLGIKPQIVNPFKSQLDLRRVRTRSYCKVVF